MSSLELFSFYAPSIVVIFFCCFSLWIISIAIKDASIIDFFWGPGFAIIACITAFPFDLNLPQLALLSLICLWGLRLGVHMFQKHKTAGQEDIRYQRIRNKISIGYWWKSALIIFGFQALIMLFMAYPYALALSAPADSITQSQTIIPLLGVIIAFFGFCVEVIADRQLKIFKKNRASQLDILQHGLWKYSRHPNYLGEIIFTYGLSIITFSLAGAWAFIPALTITFLLYKVSGVPLSEKTMTDKSEEYKKYREKTAAIFPRLF